MIEARCKDDTPMVRRFGRARSVESLQEFVDAALKVVAAFPE